MTTQRFEEMPVWQYSIDLARRVLRLVQDKAVARFRGLTRQLEESALAVSTAIAAGVADGRPAQMADHVAAACVAAARTRSMLWILEVKPSQSAASGEIGRLKILADRLERYLAGWAANLRGEPAGPRAQQTGDHGEPALARTTGPVRRRGRQRRAGARPDGRHASQQRPVQFMTRAAGRGPSTASGLSPEGPARAPSSGSGGERLAQPRDKPSRPRFSMPAALRLKRQRDFDRVYRARCSVADARLVLYAAANELDHPRLGLAVGKRLGHAVRRNRYKRLLRESFRLGQHELPAGFDYIVIPRSATGPATLADYRGSLARLAEQAVAKWRSRPEPQPPPAP